MNVAIVCHHQFRQVLFQVLLLVSLEGPQHVVHNAIKSFALRVSLQMVILYCTIESNYSKCFVVQLITWFMVLCIEA